MSTNAKRQRAFREAQRAKGRKTWTVFLTEDEKFYLERTLECMRENEAAPSLCRDRKGKYVRVDI